MFKKDHAGELMPGLILPDLDMTLARALNVIIGYCNKHERCEDGCKLWDDDAPRCILRNDLPPCDWEPIIKAVKEQEGE